MKKKVRKLFFMVILFIMLFSISMVYGEKKIDPIFLSATQVEEKGSFDIGIDTSLFEQEEITIRIQTDKQLEKPDVMEEDGVTTVDNIYQEKEVTIQAMKNIGIVLIRYCIPEQVKSEEQIHLTVTILSEEEVIYTKQLEVTVIEKDNEAEDENKEDKQSGQQENIQEQGNGEEKMIQNNNKTTMTEIPNNKNINNIKNSVQTNGKVAQTITYAGSSNNYLTSLSVEDKQIAFNKTKNTYFVSIEKEQTNINVNCETEESTARVCIYGDNDLKEGLNKVLITVTAENGSVRNYRIYVTRGEV